MADFKSCIVQAVAKGEIDADVAEMAQQTYDDAVEALGETLSPVEADRQAAKVTMDALEAARIETKRQQVLQIRARRQILNGVAGLKTRRGYAGVQALGGGGGRAPKGGWTQGGTPGGKYKAVAARALELLVENKPGLSGAPFPSLVGRHREIRGRFDAHMAAIIEKFETKFGFDTPGRADMDNVVREAFGQNTGDQVAQALAKAWADTADMARQMFNAAGGNIGKLGDWGLPQHHDTIRVREMGKAQWVAYVQPLLDPARMIDRATGQPFAPRRLTAVLGDVWESIASSGAVNRQPGAGMGRGKLGNQRQEHRFLIFKDADAWMKYQGDLGQADPYQAMMGHLDDMARDIAQMQLLGPNPDHQWEWLKNFAAREASIEEKNGVKGAEQKARSYLRTSQNMMDFFTGEASLPVNADLAKAGASMRSYLTGTMLGSSIISDVPSAPVFGVIGRAWSGLSVKGDMSALVKMIASPQYRRYARRSGFIIEQATDGFARATQDNLRLMSVGANVTGNMNAFMRRLPAFVMRAQGMTGWDAARKRTFRFEFMGALHDKRGMTLQQMAASSDREDKVFAELLNARGFTPQDWDIIRATSAWSPAPGADFLRPMDIADAELGMRVGEMIELQARLAVPQTSVWTQAKLIGTSRPGEWKGEFDRSWAMFRSFSLTASNLMIEETALRAVRSGNAPLYSASFAAATIAALTLAGAVSIQLREVIKGNTPRDMFDEETGEANIAFWQSAMAQGGGVGILGDFAYAAQARNGKSSSLTSYGPVGTAVSDAYNLTVGNISEVVQGIDEGESFGEAIEGARIGRDASQIMRNYSPVSSLWWARTVWNRSVADQLQILLDPEAEESFRTRARNMEKTTGSEQWWPNGEPVPTSQ